MLSRSLLPLWGTGGQKGQQLKTTKQNTGVKNELEMCSVKTEWAGVAKYHRKNVYAIGRRKILRVFRGLGKAIRFSWSLWQ